MPSTANNYVETYGSAFSYGTAGTYTGMTTIAGIKNVRGLPNSKADKVEITRVDQADRFKQFIATMIDAGMLQLTFGMFKTDYNTLLGLLGTRKSFKFLFSQSSSDAFDGFIEAIGPRQEAANGEITVDVDIQASGARTFTA